MTDVVGVGLSPARSPKAHIADTPADFDELLSAYLRVRFPRDVVVAQEPCQRLLIDGLPPHKIHARIVHDAQTERRFGGCHEKRFPYPKSITTNRPDIRTRRQQRKR